MAFSLANFGLAAGSARDVLNERVSRERADQDREYQLAKRKREEDDALIKQEEAKRDRAYAEELRATLPKYLSGGANATPAQPAVPGEVLDPFAVDGGEVARTAQPAKPAGDNTTGLYEALKGVAAKYGRLDHYEAMKKRIKTAADEGVIDFIAKARQGLPEPELLASFNQNGKVKLKGLRRAGEDEFAAVTEDGQPIRLNLTSLTESLLAPKDLLTHRDKGEKTAATLEARRLSLEQQDRANQARAGEREARILAATAQADLAAARADRVRNPVEKPPKPIDFVKLDNAVGSQLKPEYPKEDYAGYAMHKATVSALLRRDPERWKDDLPGAIAEARRVVGETKEAARRVAVKEAEAIEVKAKRTLLPDRSFKEASGGKASTKKRFIEQRTNELASESLAGKSPAPARQAAAPAPDGIPQITSDEDFNALPPGAEFIDPDGKRRRKP